uniref:Uncharacterized protein n=1 Tax=Rhizophagus irregularis (strain DAOM 181602 / DAOM 197198 / MUCL 43194) TaxID=747089 RepID=U9UQ99_RHIID
MSRKTEPLLFIKGVYFQPTLSEIFFDGAEKALATFIENGDMPTPNPVLTSQPELPDVVMTSVNQPVTSEILRKEEINKSTRATDDKENSIGFFSWVFS